MDQQQQRRVNEVAEQFAGALVDSYRALAELGVSAQELDAQLTQQFFNTVIDNLRRSTEQTRGASQELAGRATPGGAGRPPSRSPRSP